MKSQRYRISDNKVWRIYGQRARDPYKYIRKSRKYGDRLLPSGFYEGPTYGALHKAWLGFVIAIKKLEWDKIDLYAKRIQNLQRELGIEVSDFSDWGVE